MSGVTYDPYLRRKVVARRQPKPCKKCGQPLSDYFLAPHYCKEPTDVSAADDFLGLDEPLRDQWKRPLIVPPEGGDPVAYTRVSTFAGLLDDAGGLTTWKARMTARGIAQSEDLAAMVAGLTFTGDKKADHKANRLLDEHIETAVCRVTDAAAHGTAVHSFTEPDPSPHVPERMRADVDSYHEALERHGLVCVEAETFVVHDGLRVAGTFDGIWEHPTLGRVLGDKKTGSVKAHAVAVQLACYAGAQRYGWDPVSREDLGVRQDVGLLFHIPRGEGKTEVHLVDLEAGREAARAAAWVRSWRGRGDLLTYLNPLTLADLLAS